MSSPWIDSPWLFWGLVAVVLCGFAVLGWLLLGE